VTGSTRKKSFRFDWTETDSVTHEVVEAVAAVSGRDPTALDPIASQIDPDALDTLFEPRRDGEQRTSGHVTFPFDGYEVTVYAHGEIAVDTAGTATGTGAQR
jgi:hypothetical protein